MARSVCFAFPVEYCGIWDVVVICADSRPSLARLWHTNSRSKESRRNFVNRGLYPNIRATNKQECVYIDICDGFKSSADKRIAVEMDVDIRVRVGPAAASTCEIKNRVQQHHNLNDTSMQEKSA